MIKNEYLKQKQMKGSQAEQGHEIAKVRVKDNGKSIGERRRRGTNFDLSKFLINDAPVSEEPKRDKNQGQESPAENQRRKIEWENLRK